MPSDNNPKSTPPAEPFRKPAIWGRPPQTTFRAGPLPRGERLPPLPELPRSEPPRSQPPVIATPHAAVPQQQPPQLMGTRPDIFSGSMIPRPAYKPSPPLPTQQQVRTETSAVETSPDASPVTPAPDLTVRPLPTPATAQAAAATALTPVAAQRTPVPASDQPQASASRPVEAVAGTSPISTPITQTRARAVRKTSRMPLIAGGAVAVLAVAAAGVWWVNRAPVAPAASVAPATSLPASTEAVPAAAPVADATPATATSDATTTASTPTTAPVASPPTRTETTPSPRTTTPAAPRPAPASTPAPTPAPTVQSPPLVIEIAPTQPVGPPPTIAAPPTSDPDAPVVTRPQPLD